MKQANVFVRDRLAGVLTADDKGYFFQYDKEYLSKPDSEAVSLTLPLQDEVFESRYLFPFFDGLIPEGWLLDIAQKNWKISSRDRMELLMICCRDCIGAAEIYPTGEERKTDDKQKSEKEEATSKETNSSVKRRGNKCLYCYKELDPEDEFDYHVKCSKEIFGTAVPPALPYTKDRIEELALEVVRSQTAVTGVQPKLSLELEDDSGGKRFTIVGLWGAYILKPQTDLYPNLPELEDLTMHLAQLSKIKTVPHSLIRFEDGSLCYITRRIDRNSDGYKFHMEDMCQLTERLTEDKYKGSYEQIAKRIQKYSRNPGFDLINFAEQLVFCYLTGNSDMHLKNFSLLKIKEGYELSPAYDMVATTLVIPEDTEETALMLNATKKRIQKADFEAAFETMKIDKKSVENVFRKFERVVPTWFDFIDQSFLPDEMKEEYKALVKERSEKLELM